MANVYDTRQANTSTGTSGPKQERASQDEARDTAQGIGTQLRDTVEEIGAQLRDTAQDMSTQAQELATQAKETVSEYYEQGRETLQALPQTLEAQIRARPFQALLVAGGIGLLIGLLWRRS
jgi:ElaB/YqjD/DUF883 family membrane-anchored ribosome-binding protein